MPDFIVEIEFRQHVAWEKFAFAVDLLATAHFDDLLHRHEDFLDPFLDALFLRLVDDGLGDLVLTASSSQSRNFAFGERLGRGASPEEASGGKLAEGAFTAAALIALADRQGVEMPVAEAVAAIVSGEASVEAVIAALLARPLKGEAE